MLNSKEKVEEPPQRNVPSKIGTEIQYGIYLLFLRNKSDHFHLSNRL